MMRTALAAVLGLALITHFSAHVAIAVQLARKVSIVRALIAFVIPPLAPLWAWRAEVTQHRRLTYVWAGSLALYAVGVALA